MPPITRLGFRPGARVGPAPIYTISLQGVDGMPFKSQAQRAKFREMVKEGKISQATFDEWQAATGDAHLPERVKPQPAGPIRLPRRTKSASTKRRR